VEHEESGREPRNGSYSQGGYEATNGLSATGPAATGNGANGHASHGSAINGSGSNSHAKISANGQHKNGQALHTHPAIVGLTPAAEPAEGADVDEPIKETAPRRRSVPDSKQLQQLGEARRRQGLSVRCVAQRLGMSVGEVRAQEEEDADLLLSELYRWQSVLEVPLEELLSDPQDALSPKVLMRARMLRVMKTAQALRTQARSEAERRLSKLMISQLIEIMPELKEVAAWPTVGHRRTADEMGRIAERTIPDDFMHEAS
jgi:transcriptional regulator with XRE-family HTH domain